MMEQHFYAQKEKKLVTLNSVFSKEKKILKDERKKDIWGKIRAE